MTIGRKHKKRKDTFNGFGSAQNIVARELQGKKLAEFKRIDKMSKWKPLYKSQYQWSMPWEEFVEYAEKNLRKRA